MMHSQSINNKINRVHERALRIVYKNKFSSFENLLEKDKVVKIHVRSLQVLVTEMLNPLSANPTKWSNTLKQFFGKLPTNCLIVLDHFVILTLKGLKSKMV